MSVLTYIGSGVDTSILKADLQNIGIFIFVDSQPRSEWGEVEACEKNQKTYKKSDFIKNLKKELKKVGFTKVRRYVLNKLKKGGSYYNPGVIIFRSKDYSRFLYYFYSITYPSDNQILNDFLKTSDYLFVQGHEPGDNIVSRMYQSVTFIGGNTTCYSGEDTENSLFSTLDQWKSKIKNWIELDMDSLELKTVDSSHFFP